MFVLTPLFPLIGAVGYIFGVSRQESAIEAGTRRGTEDTQQRSTEGETGARVPARDVPGRCGVRPEPSGVTGSDAGGASPGCRAGPDRR